MDLSEWFTTQLTSSANGFTWAVEQVPVERREMQPAEGLGEWSTLRHLFHLYYYERRLALPHMRYWLGTSLPDYKHYDDDATAWEKEGKTRSIEWLLQEFRNIRAEQLALLPRFDETLWQEKRECVWGNKNMQWIVTKTLQHTMQHTHDVLAIALFWDDIVARQQAREEEKRKASESTEGNEG